MGVKMKIRKRRLHYKNRKKLIWVTPELHKPFIQAVTMLDDREIDFPTILDFEKSFVEYVKKIKP
jgi:hypothetical protein